MESFFKKLQYCESVILTQDAIRQSAEGQEKYSQFTKHTLRRLIAFVEAGDFTKAKSSKFIAKNFRHSIQELTDMWIKEFGRAKSQHTIRCQISHTSNELYTLFSTHFDTDLLEDEPDAVADMLNVLQVGTCYFADLFPAELDRRIGTADTSEAFPFMLSKEFAFLNRYRMDKFEHDFSELDATGLACIKQALNEPLVIDHTVNYNKIEYLRQLNIASKLNEGNPQEVLVHPALTDIFTESTNSKLEDVDAFRKDELKRLFYMLYTKDGLQDLLSGYSDREVIEAIQEIKRGI